MLLKKRNSLMERESYLEFSNLEECLKIENTINTVLNKTLDLARKISPYMKNPEKLPITPEDIMISNREAAKLLGVAPRTLSRYRLEGRIGCIEISPFKFLFRKRDIVAYLNRQYKAPRDYLE